MIGRESRPTCCSPSARRPGLTFWPEPCSPNNCGARQASLRTIPIIAKDSAMNIRLVAALLFAAALAGSLARAQGGHGDEARAISLARQQANEALARSKALEQQS